MTDSELAELRRRAGLAGVSPPRYLLEEGLFGGKVTVAERRRRIAEFSRVQGQLGRLVRALEAVATSVSEGALPLGIAEALERLDKLQADLNSALERLVGAWNGLAVATKPRCRLSGNTLGRKTTSMPKKSCAFEPARLPCMPCCYPVA